MAGYSAVLAVLLFRLGKPSFKKENLLSLFSQVELSHFSGIIYNKVNGQALPGGHNSYSFIQILLKLNWCFGHGLKICSDLYIILRLFFVIFFHS